MKNLLVLKIIVCISITCCFAEIFKPGDIIVAADGTGDFKTFTEAINSLPMYNYERRVIFIKKGIYREKIRIEQDYITLRGENRDSTIICFEQPRPEWENKKDWIGPGVINIIGDDLIIENLTVENTQTQAVHAFALYGTGNRVVTVNCNFISRGGDTVSLWNYKSGMYYHAGCNFKGQVDFVCPRGWCFIRNCKFFEVKVTATLWHAGAEKEGQKLVLRNCSFDGVKGFQLGRHHYEAQFYLLDCQFSKNLADKPIYRVEDTIKKRSVWGNRCYYFNCHGDSIDFKWFTNNLQTAKGSPGPEHITPAWTFDGMWDPESKQSPQLIDYKVQGHYLWLYFNENLSFRDSIVVQTYTGRRLLLKQSRGIEYILQFKADEEITEKELHLPLQLINGTIYASTASVYERRLGKLIDLQTIKR